MRRSLTRLALLLTLSPISAAGDLTVAPGGIGADFAEIDDAVMAASPGDRIIVSAGSYAGFVVDRAVTILGAGSGVVEAHAALVAGIPAGKVAVISGLELKRIFDAYEPVPTELAGLTILACPGTVVLNDLAIHSGGPGHAMRVEDAARLLGTACSLFPESSTTPTLGLRSSALSLRSSSAWFIDTNFEGAFEFFTAFDGGGDPVPPIDCVDSELSLTGCSASGLSGVTSGGFIGGPVPHEGAPGLRASGSTIRIAGGRSSTFEGGDGTVTYTVPGASGLDLRDGSVATVDANVTLMPGADGCDVSVLPAPGLFPCEGTGPGEAPEITADASSSYAVLGFALPAVTTDIPSAPVGWTIEIELTANPKHPIATALAFGIGPPFDVSFIEGTVHVDLPLTFALGPALFADGQGEASIQLTIPDISFLHGLPLYFQALEEVGPGSFRLSDPAVFVIWP